MVLQRHAAAEPPRVPLELARDAIAPLRVVEDDEVLLETRLVLVEAADLDRAAGPAAGRQEAMAVGQRARLDVLHLRTGGIRRAADRERHDAAAVEEQQPADRPAEHELAAPVVERRVPVHLLGKRHVAQHRAEHVGQRVDRRSCRAGASETTGTPLRPFSCGRAPRQSTPCFLAKPTAAGVGCPSGPNAADTGGPVIGLLEVLLPLGNLPQPRGQSPRRAEASTGAPGAMRASFSRASTRSPSCRVSPGSQAAGSSSTPISMRSSLSIQEIDSPVFTVALRRHHDCASRTHEGSRRHEEHGEFTSVPSWLRAFAASCEAAGASVVALLWAGCPPALLPHPPLGDRHRQLPDAQDVGHALGDADAAARHRAG